MKIKEIKFKEMAGWWVVIGIVVWIISVTMDWNTRLATALWLIIGMLYLVLKILQPTLTEKADKVGNKISERFKSLSDE